MDSNTSINGDEIARVMQQAFAIAEMVTDEDVSDCSDSEFLVEDQGKVEKPRLSDDREKQLKTFRPSDSGYSADFLVAARDMTPEVVESMEQNLSFYERVALVFLLYESEELALQRLRAASLSPYSIGLVSDWAAAEDKNNPHWQLKLLEALSIIQNYSLIKKFGVSKSDAEFRFSPHNPNTSVYVTLARKILYIVCESLDVSQASRVLDLMKENIAKKFPDTDFWPFDPELMEMAILQMMSLRFLKMGKDRNSWNVSLLLQCLKSVGATDVADRLELIATAGRRVDSNFPALDQSESGKSLDSLLKNRVSVEKTSVSSTDDSFRYPMNPKSVGLCVIINQKIFYRDDDPSLQHVLPEDPLEERIGTDVDRDRLCEAFTSLGFSILVEENLTHIQIDDLIRQCVKEHIKKEHSSFVLCLLSHGKRNAIYGSNSVPIDVYQLENKLHGTLCPQLFSKPKIIIIQACQGVQRQQALPCDNLATDGPVLSKTAPEVGDMVVFWSTVPGYAAFRDKLSGSWFIRALWNELLSGNTPKNIITVFTRVIGQVSEKQAVLDGEIKAMIPTYTSTFRRDLVFPYLPAKRAEAAAMIYKRIMFKELLSKFVNYFIIKIKKKLPI